MTTTVHDKNWDRWVFASIATHFDTKTGALNMYVEGQHRNTRELKDYIELRVDGPDSRQVSRGCWKLHVAINVLVSSVYNETDFHRLRRNTGLVKEAFTVNIPVYKLGDGADDDQSLLGCLKLQQGLREPIELTDFGRIEPDVPMTQATVEGQYIMTLDT